MVSLREIAKKIVSSLNRKGADLGCYSEDIVLQELLGMKIKVLDIDSPMLIAEGAIRKDGKIDPKKVAIIEGLKATKLSEIPVHMNISEEKGKTTVHLRFGVEHLVCVPDCLPQEYLEEAIKQSLREITDKVLFTTLKYIERDKGEGNIFVTPLVNGKLILIHPKDYAENMEKNKCAFCGGSIWK